MDFGISTICSLLYNFIISASVETDDYDEKRETLGLIQKRVFRQASYMYDNEAMQVLHTFTIHTSYLQ